MNFLGEIAVRRLFLVDIYSKKHRNFGWQGVQMLDLAQTA